MNTIKLHREKVFNLLLFSFQFDLQPEKQKGIKFAFITLHK